MKTILKIVGIGILVLILFAACAPDTPEPEETTTEEATEVTVTEEDVVTEEETEEATEEATEEETEETTEEEETADGVGSRRAGEHYLIEDIQVRKDFIDDFEVRARVTNEGESRSVVVLAATIFLDGSVVGSLSGVHSDWASGETITMEFIGLDEYGEWDDIEFQVDSQF